MRTKRNIRDDFERVYLRYNQAMRDLPKAKVDELKSDEFKKVCRYTANKSFYGNESFFLNNGFDYDDILSLATIYGACYLGYKDRSEAYDSRRYYLMMTAFIIQRLNRFVGWTAKKMQVDEVIDRVDIETLWNDKNIGGSIRSAIMIDGIPMWGEEQDKSLEEQLGDLNETLEMDKPKGNQAVKLKKQIKETKTKILVKKRDQNKVFKQLKEEITSDPQKYQDKLVYYACTKHVSSDVRKVARRYCDKFGIDYKARASEVFKGVSPKNFDV